MGGFSFVFSELSTAVVAPTTCSDYLIFNYLLGAALAEFERDMIRERTRAGLAAAHKRGVAIGRPRALTPEQILMAKAMTTDPAISIRQVAEQFGIPPLDALSAPQRASETLRLTDLGTTLKHKVFVPLLLGPQFHSERNLDWRSLRKNSRERRLSVARESNQCGVPSPRKSAWS